MEATFLTKIPCIGFATRKERTSLELVKSAIVDYNYQLIDTASSYEVGQGIQDAYEKVPRKDLFVISKA